MYVFVLLTGINYYIIAIHKVMAPIKKLLLFKLFLVHTIQIHTGSTCTTQTILHLDPVILTGGTIMQYVFLF